MKEQPADQGVSPNIESDDEPPFDDNSSDSDDDHPEPILNDQKAEPDEKKILYPHEDVNVPDDKRAALNVQVLVDTVRE